MKSIPKLQQEYEAYTAEDLQVWNTLYTRQMKHLQHTACNAYLEAQEKISFTSERIPHFGEMNHSLADATGWGLTVVPCIVQNDLFFPQLATRKFTATTWLRKMSELDYISEPDMFHDVFGHVPLLSHNVFADFFHRFGELGTKYINHPEAIEMLGRVYWFTVEFGLIEEDNKTKIFGAGLISSYAESDHCLSDKVQRKPFNIHDIMHQTFNNTVMQDLYFVLPSFETLLHSLEEVENVLRKEIRQ